MLKWFSKRLKEAQEKDGQAGFTLIELLVVVIIIGILAAIAIPTFLAQRERAWEAAAQSDLRNAAAAATSCSTANSGSFASCASAGQLSSFGFNQTAQVNYTNDTANATTWAAHTIHALDTTRYDFSTAGANAGRVTCTANCP